MKKLIVIAAAAFIGIAASAQSVKFAHVNYDELVALSPAADSARVVLQKAQKDAMEELQMMQEEAQNKYQQYQQKASTWTASVRESKERELQEMSSRIQDFQQSAQADLQQLQNNKMAPIYQKAREVVNDLAEDRLSEAEREDRLLSRRCDPGQRRRLPPGHRGHGHSGHDSEHDGGHAGRLCVRSQAGPRGGVV